MYLLISTYNKNRYTTKYNMFSFEHSFHTNTRPAPVNRTIFAVVTTTLICTALQATISRMILIFYEVGSLNA